MGKLFSPGLFVRLAAACLLIVFPIKAFPQESKAPVASGLPNGQFRIKFDAGAIVSLRRTDDRVDTDYIQTGRRLGDVFLRYRGKDAAWVSADTAQLAQSGAGIFALSQDGRNYTATYQILYGPPSSNTGPTATRATPTPVLTVKVDYTIEERDVVCTLTIQN